MTYGYAGIATTDEDGLVEPVSTRTAKDSEMTHFAAVVMGWSAPVAEAA